MERPGLQQRTYLGHWPVQPLIGAAANRDLARIRVVQPHDQPHRGRLARAVKTEEPGHHPRLHAETQPVHRGCRPVPLDQPAYLDHLTSGCFCVASVPEDQVMYSAGAAERGYRPTSAGGYPPAEQPRYGDGGSRSAARAASLTGDSGTWPVSARPALLAANWRTVRRASTQ